MKEMKFQVLISTVDDKFMKRHYNVSSSQLIINQLINKGGSSYDGINIYSYKEKGLSKSRNQAISLSDADLCLISDEDVLFATNFDQKVIKAFEEYPDSDVITFQVETFEGEPYKKYKSNTYIHNIRSIMKVSSVEIAFRKRSILDKKIYFDENFGLGTEFPTGEEIIFLSDCLNAGLTLRYYPKVIVRHPKESSGGNFNNMKLIEAKGAMFYRIFGVKSYLISMVFALKKSKFSKFSILRFYQLMLNGINRLTNGK